MKHYIASGSYRDFDPDVWQAHETRQEAAWALREYYDLSDVEYGKLMTCGRIKIELAPGDNYDLSIIPCDCDYPEMHTLEVLSD